MHSSSSDIRSKVCKSGCAELVHHLLTVDGFFPNCSANHLLVFFFSTRTTFSRFKSFIPIFIDLNANLMVFLGISLKGDYILIKYKDSTPFCATLHGFAYSIDPPRAIFHPTNLYLAVSSAGAEGTARQQSIGVWARTHASRPGNHGRVSYEPSAVITCSQCKSPSTPKRWNIRSFPPFNCRL